MKIGLPSKAWLIEFLANLKARCSVWSSTGLGWILNKFIYSAIPLIFGLYVFKEPGVQLMYGFVAFNMTLLVTAKTASHVDFTYLGNWEFIKHLIFMYILMLAVFYGGYSLILNIKLDEAGQTWKDWLFSPQILSHAIEIVLFSSLVGCALCDWPLLREEIESKTQKYKRDRAATLGKLVGNWKDELQ